MRIDGRFVLCLMGILGAAVAAAQEAFSDPVLNWPAPATWAPTGTAKGLSTMASITSPLPFIGVTPCRLVDTRGTGGVPINTGGKFAADEVRTWTFTGLCGLPSVAAAVSLNITVTGTDFNAFGYVKVWPGGGTEPNVSTLNWSAANTTASNAAIVPLGSSPAGSVSLRSGNAGSHVIVDVNGYYAGAGVDPFGNTFLGSSAGNFTMTGNGNTGIGVNALAANTTGSNNTAVGGAALLDNTGGNYNTAIGVSGLRNNTTGNENTATGYNALFSNTTGFANTATGSGALYSSTTNGGSTAVGYHALYSNVSGYNNTAIGLGALKNSTGLANTAIGYNAGLSLISGDFNLYLGNEGLDGDSNTIRLGSGPTHTRLFVAGVLVSPLSGTQVLISNTGQLGIPSSSSRYKEEIQDMGDSSDRLSKLRPVTFRYKGHADEPMQFGLIAEEVERVLPELVFHSASGQPEAILYHELPAMLLNELQKQQQRIDRQALEIARLLERVQALEGRQSAALAR